MTIALSIWGIGIVIVLIAALTDSWHGATGPLGPVLAAILSPFWPILLVAAIGDWVRGFFKKDRAG